MDHRGRSIFHPFLYNLLITRIMFSSSSFFFFFFLSLCSIDWYNGNKEIHSKRKQQKKTTDNQKSCNNY